MTSVERFGVAATGVEFQAVVRKADGSPHDISAATAQDWIFEPPGGGAPLVRSGSFVSDGTDGASKYVTTAADFTVAGRWRRQAKITGPGYVYPTDVIGFDVFVNLA